MKYDDVVKYTDRKGRVHLCEPAGFVRTVTFKGKNGMSLKKELMRVVYDNTFDAFVQKDCKVSRCPSMTTDVSVYIVETQCGVYFVKSLGEKKYTIAANDAYGPSPFGSTDFTVRAVMVRKDLLIFALFDKETKKRASSFYYVGF